MHKRQIVLAFIFACILLSSCATRTITSIPTAAAVYSEDGAYLGITPHKMTDAVGFTRQCFYLKKEGFHDSGAKCLDENITGNQTLQIRMKPIIRVPANLDSIQKSTPSTITKTTFGYVKLSANIDDVGISINNQHAGTIKEAGNLLNKKLPVGIHDITAKRKFYLPLSIRVTLTENDVVEYDFKLFRAKDIGSIMPTETTNVQILKGTLTVLTERPDMTVLIEGKKMRPPFKLRDIPAGQYRLRVKGNGLDELKNITVMDRQDTILDLDRHFNNKQSN